MDEENKTDSSTMQRRRSSRSESMAQTYAVLEKRLQEFETQLDQLFSHPSYDDLGLRRKLAFLRSLLSAEMETHSEAKPEHLAHVARRLDVLEDAFNKWEGEEPLPDYPWLDGPPPCSCTDSCFDEDECKVDESEVDGGSIATVLADETNLVACQELLHRESVVQNSQEKGRGRWLIGAKIAGGVAVILVAAIGTVISCWVKEEELFLVPT